MMTPIPAVVTVDADETVEAALRRCVTSGHTRLVVIEDDNPDRVKGVVHNNSLARVYMSDGPEAAIESVIRDALIVPETRPLDDLLHDLQVQRTSLSVVVDEYGRTVGIVTVEDILEEVVGEIEDETDPRAAEVRRLTNGDWFVRGHVSLGDLEDAGIDLPADSDAYNSVGGYVFGELGRLPKRGDSVTVDGYTLRVEAVRENRIEAVRISDRRAVPSVPPLNFSEQPASRAKLEVPPMWVVRLTDKQLEVLRALLRSEEHLGPALRGSIEALDLARWDELPEAALPWEEIETAARRQNISEADVIWDLSGKGKARRAARRAPIKPPQHSVVGVEAGAALAAQLRLADHLDDQAGRLVRRVAGVGEEGVADRLGDVEADEVEQGERAHRVAGAELHAGVDLARLHAGPLDHADRVEEVGEEQAVDDEARLVGDLDRGLAERRAPGQRPLAGRSAPSGMQTSTSAIRGTGLKTWRP